MAYQVIWAEPALRDLAAIYSYISADSERYALTQVRKLLASVRRLEEFPFSGRVSSTVKREDVREIVAAPYVLLYQVDDERQRVEVKAVVHGSRKRE